MKNRNQKQLLIYFTLALILISSLLFAHGNDSGSRAVVGHVYDRQNSGQVEETPALRVRTSTQALRGMPPPPVSLAGGREKKRIHLNPNVTVTLGPPTPDPVLQKTVRRPRRRRAKGLKPHSVSLQSAPIQQIEGVGNGFTGPQGSFSIHGAPPDTVGAVGDTQFVQWVNESFVVFDKATRAKLLGPVPGNLIWRELGGNCATNNDGDPIVQYDKIARRWVLAQFSVHNGFSQCVAVSTTPDATGTYHLYEFTYQAFDDYPKMGVWPDGYYTSFNMFDNQDRSLGSRVCAFDRAKMLNGQPANQQCVQLSSTFFGLLPSDLDGATSALADSTGNAAGPAAPPAGSPNVFVNLGNDSKTLNLWKFHVDWANFHNSTFGVGPDHNPNAVIPVAPYRLACNRTGGTCIPQPGSNQPERLDTLGERLMFRLAYRRFNRPNGAIDHESLVVTHSVDVGTTSPQTAIRWYELRNPNGGVPTVFQQGSYAPDSNHRWMASIAMDKLGNIAVGYNISSSSVRPGIRYTSRAPTDTPGTLGAETILLNGEGTQRCRLPNGDCVCRLPDGSCDTLTRWGDYSALTIDPTDDCTLWYTTEYQKEDGAFNWHTRIGSFKLNNCL